jgi:phytanoyl-CoA hydroxylase
VRCFFEEEAFDADGALEVPKAQAINKIGHAQHDLDPTYDAFSRAEALAEIVDDLGVADPRLLQSMHIFKQPRIGGEVTCHQDATFLWTEPDSVVGLWFALEDATLDNGCLWAEPGGHRGPVRQRFVRAGATDADGTSFEQLDPTPLPEPGEGGSLVPLEVEAGTLVVLHGRLPHWSGPNRSDRSRHAYSVHVIDGRAEYPAVNWLQRPADLPLRGF